MIEEQKGQTPPHQEATAVQDPTPQCCYTQTNCPTARKTPSPEQPNARASPLPSLDATLACAGTSNPPLSTPLSCAGTSNPPHGTTLRTRFRDCRRGSKKRCPPGTEPSRKTTAVVRNHHVAFPLARRRRPRARRPKMLPALSSDVVPHRKGSAVLNTPLRSAASQVVTDCRCR